MLKPYDVIVVGAGMVGATLANALAKNDARVALIEPLEGKSEPPLDPFPIRVSAISYASSRIFQALGVWQNLQEQPISPFREMYVWDANSSGQVHFQAAAVAKDTLGYIIENNSIQYHLQQAARAQANIDWFCPAELIQMEVTTDQVRVRLNTGVELQAQLVVGADGSRSRVRSQAGIAVSGHAYGQNAVVATVVPQRSHQETAWQRFLTTGPLAFLPLRDGKCSIVWSTTTGQSEALLQLSDAAFCQRLSEAFEFKLGNIEQCGPRAAFPLHLQHAEKYVCPRVALIGDAAHSIHPLAGQGVNLGLLDAAALASVLSEAQHKQQDLGSMKILRRYERWRRPENSVMLYALDALKYLFENQLSPVAGMRNVGMKCFNHLAPLKNFAIAKAMGLTGELPPLAR